MFTLLLADPIIVLVLNLSFYERNMYRISKISRLDVLMIIEI